MKKKELKQTKDKRIKNTKIEYKIIETMKKVSEIKQMSDLVTLTDYNYTTITRS